jgi:HSP20 family protein
MRSILSSNQKGKRRQVISRRLIDGSQKYKQEVMTMLTNWDPFRDMMSMRRAMDRLIDSTLGEEQREWTLGVPLDVSEKEDAFLLKASLPGIDPDDIDITYQDGVLTIKGEVREDQEVERGAYRIRERRWGSFSRAVQLPSAIKVDDIEASYQNGVLRLHMPKTEEVRAKRIQIKAAEGQKMLEGKFKK